jgi:hypothetical protein
MSSFTDSLLLSALNNKLHVGGIFCDLTKAFDSVNHELLLSKLIFYVVQNIAGWWVKSYLDDRKQQEEMSTPGSNNSIYSDTQIGALYNMESSEFSTRSSAFSH